MLCPSSCIKIKWGHRIIIIKILYQGAQQQQDKKYYYFCCVLLMASSNVIHSFTVFLFFDDRVVSVESGVKKAPTHTQTQGRINVGGKPILDQLLANSQQITR